MKPTFKESVLIGDILKAVSLTQIDDLLGCLFNYELMINYCENLLIVLSIVSSYHAAKIT